MEQQSKKEISRRDFLKQIGIVGAATTMGSGILAKNFPKNSEQPIPTTKQLETTKTIEKKEAQEPIDVAWIPNGIKTYNSLFVETARINHLDPLLVSFVGSIESLGYPLAQNESSSAIGIMQIIPSTAELYREMFRSKYNYDFGSFTNLKDPTNNIRMGALILADIRDHYLEDFKLDPKDPTFNKALATIAFCYNHGLKGLHDFRTGLLAGRSPDTILVDNFQTTRYIALLIDMYAHKDQPECSSYSQYITGYFDHRFAEKVLQNYF